MAAVKKPRWVASEVRSLRRPEECDLEDAPSPRGLLNYLKLGLCSESSFVPGLIFAGVGQLTDALAPAWSYEDVRWCLGVLVLRGLVLVDPRVPVIYVPSILQQECQTCPNFAAAVEWGRCMQTWRQKSEVFEIAELELVRKLSATPSHLASYLSRSAIKNDGYCDKTPYPGGREYLQQLLCEPPIRPGQKLETITERQVLADRYRRAVQLEQPETAAAPALERGAQLDLGLPAPPAEAAAARCAAYPGHLEDEPEPAGEQPQEPSAPPAPADMKVAPGDADQVLADLWPGFVDRAGPRLQLPPRMRELANVERKHLASLLEGWRDCARRGFTRAHWDYLARYIAGGGMNWVGTKKNCEHKKPWMVVCTHLAEQILRAEQQHEQRARSEAGRPAPAPRAPAAAPAPAAPTEPRAFDLAEHLRTAVQAYRASGLELGESPPGHVLIEAQRRGCDEARVRSVWAQLLTEELVPA